MNKSILIIGNTKSKSSKRLAGEASSMGLKLDFVSPQEVSLIDGDVFFSGLKHVSDYDVFLFRGMGRDKAKLLELQKVASLLHQKGKRVVENILTEQLLPEDKSVKASIEQIYKIPESQLINSQTDLSQVSFPAVVKQMDSSMGKGVYKANTLAELSGYLSEMRGDIILQKYYELDFDVRILVVGGEVLGGLERYKKEGESFLTTKPGGKRIKANLTEREIRAAKEAVALQGLEIAGVDMFLSEGEIYIFEVNASPQFYTFEKNTGINAARKILNYLVQ